MSLNREYLIEEYVHKRRSFADIAARVRYIPE
jgi:hypothetical protein